MLRWSAKGVHGVGDERPVVGGGRHAANVVPGAASKVASFAPVSVSPTTRRVALSRRPQVVSVAA